MTSQFTSPTYGGQSALQGNYFKNLALPQIPQIGYGSSSKGGTAIPTILDYFKNP